MWIAIVAVGVVVLGLAAYAALGNLGEMPAGPVTDNPKGRVPEGPVDGEFLASAVLPRRVNGYGRDEVDAYLASVVAGEAAPPSEVTFPVTFAGYDMAVIDELLERIEQQRASDALGHEASDLGSGPTTGEGAAPEQGPPRRLPGPVRGRSRGAGGLIR
ncbi:hypothetical protein G7085_15660 [Tessaracoccus sp. HDW20]|uniref:hypothetical protein n=1 Tax=Tessaracoccus coleopterorum TaxID=2714950 RepID=UPI0018D40ED8|nr:hypothetical protein [Tessaracoccus coleopterorum]NHB85559.1 hypothetical protein [Tessaracoccus coleopterorum]